MVMPNADPQTNVPRDPQPVAVSQDGQDLASILDAALKRIADLEAVVKSSRSPPADRGKPGCKPVNADIAAFANERRPGMSWKAIYYAWKREHLNDPRNKDLTPEKVRGAWRRHFGGKGQRQSTEMRAQ
jgi:hypothetical protein